MNAAQKEKLDKFLEKNFGLPQPELAEAPRLEEYRPIGTAQDVQRVKKVRPRLPRPQTQVNLNQGEGFVQINLVTQVDPFENVDEMNPYEVLDEIFGHNKRSNSVQPSARDLSQQK